MSKNNCCKKTSIGGQALMEGIMMRGPEVTAMAVRNTKGEIVVEKFPTETKKRAKFFKLPFIRGLFNYVDSMVMGSKCLMRSAEISGLEEAEEEMRREKEAKKAAKAAKKAEKKGTITEETVITEKADEATDETPETIATNEAKSTADKKKDDSSFWMNVFMVVSVVIGLVLGIGLFMILPTFIYGGAAKIMPFLNHENPAVHSLIKSIFEGILKLVLIVGYMSLMILMKDIRRTFQFHGAEHKTIFCYEAGLELTVENIRKQKRFHPRCGTSFLILMILVSIFISFFIDPLFLITICHCRSRELLPSWQRSRIRSFDHRAQER